MRKKVLKHMERLDVPVYIGVAKTASAGSMSTHLTRMEKMDLVKAFYQK